MKKFLLFILTLCLICSAGLTAACGDDGGSQEPQVNYGTLTVVKVNVEYLGTATIRPTFSKTKYASETVTYTFTGNNISISGNTVTGRVADTTTKVTASALGGKLTTEFNVIVGRDYGTLTVNNIAIPYSATQKYDITKDFVYSKSKPSSDTYSFTYSPTGNITIDRTGKLSALKPNTMTQVTMCVKNNKTDTCYYENVTFTVTVGSDYGTMTISNKTLCVGETLDVSPSFSKTEFAPSSFTYDFDSSAFTISNGKITAKTVTSSAVPVIARGTYHDASAGVDKEFSAQFNVTVTNPYKEVNVLIDGTYEMDSYIDNGEDVSYTYSKQNICTVDGAAVTGVALGTVTVTAKTDSGCLATFTVNVLEPFTVVNRKAYLNYKLDITPFFGDGITRSVTMTPENTTYFTINDYVLTPKALGSANVTASFGGHTKTFKVDVVSTNAMCDESTLGGNNQALSSYQTSFSNKLSSYKTSYNSLPSTQKDNVTLFVGDSFIDTSFFTDFSSRFSGKLAYAVGVSSTRASHWQFWIQEVLACKPKNLVIHIGTNDCYDGKSTPEATMNYLVSIFETVHRLSPDTHIYWWTIERRRNDSTRPNDVALVEGVNKYMNVYAVYANESREDWFTIVNTRDVLSNDLYIDNTHPSCPAGYDALMEATYAAGLKLSENNK